MANAISKTADARGIYAYVENIMDFASYPSANWYYDPDVSALSAVDRNYWVYVSDGDTKVQEMNQAQKDVVDAALLGLPVREGQVYTDCQTYAHDEEKCIILPAPLTNMVVHVMDPNVQHLVGGTLLSPTGTGYDPGNVSTGELLINNGTLSDLCYNNSSTANTPGLVYGIDMGSSTPIMAMKRYDYSAAYYDTQWEFIGTNDDLTGKDTGGRFFLGGSPNVSWEVIFTKAQSEACLNPNPHVQAFTERVYRYYAVRCVTSSNATYSIISELELYGGGSMQTVEQKLSVNVDYEYSASDEYTVCIKNITGDTKELKVVVMGAA